MSNKSDYDQHNFDKYLGETRPKYYLGAAKKQSFRLDGKVYMLKYPSKAEIDNGLNTVYSHNSFSEFISCHIINDLELKGVTAQNTLLGISDGKIAVACEDFTQHFKPLVSFDMIQNADINSEASGRHPCLQDVLNTYKTLPELRNPAFLERFWDTFALDALLGNFDRHSGNWGFLQNSYDGALELAPIYDCGSCLYPALSDEQLPAVMASEEERNLRIFNFPQSALKGTDNKKIGYSQLLMSGAYPDCNRAVKKLTESFDANKVQEIIEQTPYATDERKAFYNVMIQERMNKLLYPAYQKHFRSFAVQRETENVRESQREESER